jgi:hypothetical protein
MRHIHIITFRGKDRAQLINLLRYLEQSGIPCITETCVKQDTTGLKVEFDRVIFATDRNIHFDFRKG